MATRRRAPESPPIQPKLFTSPQEIDLAIKKLRKRLDEIKALDPKHVAYNDQEVYNIEHRVRDTILEAFGNNSTEYDRHKDFRIRYGILSGDLYIEDIVARENALQEQFANGIPRAVTRVEGLIKSLEEKQSDFGSDIQTRLRGVFKDLDLHPRIASVSADLFRDGHYRNAVLDAAVALVNFVKEKSGRHDLDGADLMRRVFSKNNPVLAFNYLWDQSELDEQEGLMHLFEGAVLALRNPRAHQLVQDLPEEALEYIGFLSYLAKLLDRAKRTAGS
jgi:uncharacterized protein (TIGR02391 family)